MDKNRAYETLNNLFEEHGWRSDLADSIKTVLTEGKPLTTLSKNAVSDELTRLSYEIPFQRMMKDETERQKCIAQKEAYELVLELSKEAEEKAKKEPNPKMLQTFNLKLALSRIERSDVKLNEIDRIQRGLADEIQELSFVECLFGIDTLQYKVVLKEIEEWQKLLDEAVEMNKAV